jgi:5-methylcytosine-specific restriction endonuclease McrA
MRRRSRASMPLGIWAALLRRDGESCGICGRPLDPDDDPTEVDHKFPVCRGGGNDLANLRLTHRSCNRYKGKQVWG